MPPWLGLKSWTMPSGHGPEMVVGEANAERDFFGDVVLVNRLREAIRRFNPAMAEEAREEALRKVLRLETTAFVANNRRFHTMLRYGVEVEYRRKGGSIAGDRVRLVNLTKFARNSSKAATRW
jgi:type I restriction enzyme, R subunit